MTDDPSRAANANRLHPFESSPLLGTRPPTKSWGQLVQSLDNDAENLDGNSETAGSDEEQQATRRTATPITPNRRGESIPMSRMCSGLYLLNSQTI